MNSFSNRSPRFSEVESRISNLTATGIAGPGPTDSVTHANPTITERSEKDHEPRSTVVRTDGSSLIAGYPRFGSRRTSASMANSAGSRLRAASSALASAASPSGFPGYRRRGAGPWLGTRRDRSPAIVCLTAAGFGAWTTSSARARARSSAVPITPPPRPACQAAQRSTRYSTGMVSAYNALRGIRSTAAWTFRRTSACSAKTPAWTSPRKALPLLYAAEARRSGALSHHLAPILRFRLRRAGLAQPAIGAGAVVRPDRNTKRLKRLVVCEREHQCGLHRLVGCGRKRSHPFELPLSADRRYLAEPFGFVEPAPSPLGLAVGLERHRRRRESV